MEQQNHYDALFLFTQIKADIAQQKRSLFLTGVAFFILLMVVLPMAILLFFSLLFHADLPLLDHSLIRLFQSTKLFLLPYTILLVFYFTVMYFNNKKLHLINQVHFKKAMRYFEISLVIVVLPYIFSNHTLLSILYFIFFILTIYYMSLTYYDVALQEAYSIHNHLYRSEDLGWELSYGMVDNPLSIQDDINRAKLFVQTSTLGFDIVVLFINMMVKIAIFAKAIHHKHNIQEAARLFDLLLEEKLEGEYATFSIESKIILESINYLSFRGGNIVLHKRGEEVAKLAYLGK